MMKTMKTVLLVAALFTSGRAFKCYHCRSETEDGCKLTAGPEEMNCGIPAPNYQIVCVYKAFYDGTKHRVSSGCETIPSTSPIDKGSIQNCEDEKGTFQIKECRVCDKELCNSSDVKKFASFLLPLLYLVNKIF